MVVSLRKMGLRLRAPFMYRFTFSFFPNVSLFVLFNKDEKADQEVATDEQLALDLYVLAENQMVSVKDGEIWFEIYAIRPCSFLSPTSKGNVDIFRSSCPEFFCKKALLNHFANFVGKHLGRSHIFNFL